MDLGTGELQKAMPPFNSFGSSSFPDLPSFYLTANGSFLVFEFHNNYEDSNQPQLMWRDVKLKQNLLVSQNIAGAQGNGNSTQPWVSADGKTVLFLSDGTDLVADLLPNQTVKRLYKRDMQSATNSILSNIGKADLSNPYSIDNYAVSPDGHYVAFNFRDVPIEDERSGCFILDLLGKQPARSYRNIAKIYSFNHEGRYCVGLLTNASPDNSQGMLCRLEIETGNLITFSAGSGRGFWDSTHPTSTPIISADGQFIVFVSPDGTLTPGDQNYADDIFIRDVSREQTLLVSSNMGGNGTGNAASTSPILSVDGNAMMFRSLASDLIPGDFNNKRDLFILRFGASDSDSDGLPDDWEMTYFGNLERDGKGDFDLDGISDMAEYLAGTNPIQSTSVLRVLTLESIANDKTTVIWSAVPGRYYTVEFNDSVISTQWQVGAVHQQAFNNTARWNDLSPNLSGHRYYRVIVEQ